MSEWKARRFWKAAEVAEAEGGYTVLLDGRSVKTPNKTLLVVPGADMAAEIAREWDEQEGVINPLSMPFTRSANSALDKVAPQKAEVADMLTGYGDSDLLCYRADAPDELVARESAAWDPLLDWGAENLGARLEPRVGVMHAPQDESAMARLSALVHEMSHFELTGFHDLVSLSGSLVIGFAAARNERGIDDLWNLSRLDELWQEEQWGADDEATEMAEIKHQAFVHAKRFYDLSRPEEG